VIERTNGGEFVLRLGMFVLDFMVVPNNNRNARFECWIVAYLNESGAFPELWRSEGMGFAAARATLEAAIAEIRPWLDGHPEIEVALMERLL
jgi:hypothetical protein